MASHALLSAETAAASSSSHNPFSVRSASSSSLSSSPASSSTWNAGGRITSSSRDNLWGVSRIVLREPAAAGRAGLSLHSEQGGNSQGILNRRDFCGGRSTRQVSKQHYGRQKVDNRKHSPEAEIALQDILGATALARIPDLLETWALKRLTPDDFVYLLRELGNAWEGEKTLACYQWATQQTKLRNEWPKMLSSAIGALGRLGKVDWAQGIFDKAIADGFGKNLFAYSALISAYGRSGHCQKALELFDTAKKLNLKPNLVTYNTVIDACAKGGVALGRVVRIFEEMQSRGVQPDRITYNSILAVCSRGGLWEEAEKLFHEMETRGVERDIFTYNTLLDAFCKAGEMDRAASIVANMMLETSVKPNVVTYSTLIDGCSKAGRFSEAIALHSKMKDEGILPDRISYNTLLVILTKAGKFDEALLVFKEMEGVGLRKDAVTYNALLDAYGKQGKYHDAFCLFEKMKGNGVRPTVLTYSTLIDACTKGGLYRDAMLLFEEFKRTGLKPDVVLYSSLIDAFCKCGLVDEATNIMEEMKQAGIRPNVVTYNSIIDAYGRRGEVEIPLEVLEVVKPKGVSRNYSRDKKCGEAMKREVGSPYESLMTARFSVDTSRRSPGATFPAAKGARNDIIAAVKVFQEMRDAGVKPNVVTFSSILHACSRCASFVEATGVLEELRFFDSRVYGVTYGLLIGSKERIWGEAVTLFDQIAQMDLFTAIAFYNALADVLWTFGQEEGAKKVVLEAKRRNVWENAWQHSEQHYCLDLHLMSAGAAQAMLHAWLFNVQSIFSEGYKLPKLLSVLTGWGKHSKVAGESIVKRGVEERLQRLGSPFRVAPNKGRLVSEGLDVESWLRKPSTLPSLILNDIRTNTDAQILGFSC